MYLLRCHPGGLLAYRCVTGQSGVAETPDEAAARIGRIAVYAVAPDPVADASAVPILSFEVPHGPRASRPSPPWLQP